MSTSTSQAILAAAGRVMRDLGPRRLTLSAVAVEAGVSRPTLYRWFPSKTILLAALAADSVDRFDRGLRDTIAEAGTADQRLPTALRYIVRYLDDTVGAAAIRADPDFALQSLADTIGSHVELLVVLLDDALDRIPAVAAGRLTKREAADLMLRVAYSHYLVPHPDPDELIGAFTAFAGLAIDSPTRLVQKAPASRSGGPAGSDPSPRQ